MPKKIPDRVDEVGLKRPDGYIEWHDLPVAEKLGWTTATGRDRVQAGYDHQLAALGIPASDATLLEFFSRVRYIAWTDAELIDDVRSDEPWELAEPTPAADAVSVDYVMQHTEPTPEPAPEPEHHEDSVGLIEGLLSPKPAEERDIEQDPKTLVLDTHVEEAKVASAETPKLPSIVINNILPAITSKLPIPPRKHDQ